MPILRGESQDWRDDVFIQISESQVGRAIRTRRWKYGVNAPDKDARKDPGSDVYEEQYLYDLLADPYELNNLVGLPMYDRVSEVLGERLIRRMSEAGEQAPTIKRVPARDSSMLEHRFRVVTEADALS
jgi:arylsulfatase A-like enzyme